MWVCLRKMRVVFWSRNMGIGFYLGIDSSFMKGNRLRYMFFSDRKLEDVRNWIGLVLGYMFSDVEVLFVWRENKKKDSKIMD